MVESDGDVVALQPIHRNVHIIANWEEDGYESSTKEKLACYSSTEFSS